MKRIVYLFVCLGVSSLLLAQETISLDSCRAKAERNYPVIRKYALVEQTEHFTLQNAARAWLPQVSFTAQATWQTDVAAFPEQLQGMMQTMGTDLPGIRQDQYKLGLDVYQSIWDGGKYIAQKGVTQAQAIQEQRAADVELYNLKSRVDNLFFGVLLLEEQQKQMASLIHLLQQQEKRANALVANDVVLAADADLVRVERLSKEQQLGQLEAAATSYRRMLSLLIGEDVQGVSLEKPKAQDPQLTTLQSSTARPEWQLLQAQKDVLTAQEKHIRWGGVPTVGLFAQGWYGYPGLDMFANMMNSDWSWNAIVGVRLQWNIGAFYTQSNRLRQMAINKEHLTIQQDVFAFNNNLTQLQEQGEIARLRKTLTSDEEIVALRRSVREAAESQHENGTLSTTDLLQRITEENQAIMARQLHEMEMLKTMYEYQRTLNIER